MDIYHQFVHVSITLPRDFVSRLYMSMNFIRKRLVNVCLIIFVKLLRYDPFKRIFFLISLVLNSCFVAIVPVHRVLLIIEYFLKL